MITHVKTKKTLYIQHFNNTGQTYIKNRQRTIIYFYNRQSTHLHLLVAVSNHLRENYINIKEDLQSKNI